MLKRIRAALAGTAFATLALGVGAAEPGVSDTRVVFGQTIGFDSVWGGVYKNYSEGLTAYFDQVNAAGGVHGRKIEVVRTEDRYDTAQAVANIKRFGEANEVFGLVCIGGTAITVAAMPLLAQYRLPTVGALTGADAARRHHRYLFLTRAGYANEVEKMVGHLTTTGVRRIAVVYQDSAFGKSNFEAAQHAAAALQAQIVAAVAHPTTGWDAAAMAQRLGRANAQAVLLFSPPATVVDVMKAYRAGQGVSLPLPWVLSVTPPRKLYEGLGEQVRGIALTQVMPHPSSGASRLASGFREMWHRQGRPPNLSYEALEGYVTAHVVVEALRRAGRSLTRENYLQALESLGDFKLGELHLKYTPANHLGPSFVDVTMLGRDGVIVR